MLGCSGSVVGPDSPASGYLVSAPDTPPLVVDFGGGVLGALQRHVDPNEVHILLSHLHADHCLDLPGLFVWRRYHPTPAPERGLMYGPSDTWTRLAAASSPLGGELDDFTDIFEVRPWTDGEAVTLRHAERAAAAGHPPHRVLRAADHRPVGATLVYSGDTGVCESLVELATGADVFLCEASWTHAPDRPRHLHMSGAEAGRVANAGRRRANCC